MTDELSVEQLLGIIEESFPHVAKRIRLVTGEPEADAYYKTLMISNRADRSGFPPEVAAAIMKLYTLQATDADPINLFSNM